MADREMETSAEGDQQAGDEKGESDEVTAEVGHRDSGGEEHGVYVAEEVGGLTGLGEDGHGLAGGLTALVRAADAAVGSGEDEDAAAGEIALEAGDELEAVLSGHVDVADDELGGEDAGTGEALIGGSGGTDIEAAFGEDEIECIGDEGFVIHYKNAAHA